MQAPTPLTIIIVIGLVLATILAVRTIPVTMHYNIEYLNNLACSYKALFTGDLKTYTTCSINALRTMWEAFQAWPGLVTRELGW